MADTAPPQPVDGTPDGDADDAYDVDDERHLADVDLDRLDELSDRMSAVSTKDDAKALYRDLAGGA